MLDTEISERLNCFIDVQKERKHEQNNNKSKFVCQLIFITENVCGMPFVQRYKIRPYSVEGEETDSTCLRTMLETPEPELTITAEKLNMKCFF